MKFHEALPALATIRSVNSMTIGTAVEIGDLVLLSGLVPMDAATGEVLESLDDAAQARAAVDLVELALGDLGLDLGHVVKITAYLAENDVYAAWNGEFNVRFAAPRPLRTTVMAGLLGGRLELDVIATRTRRTESAA